MVVDADMLDVLADRLRLRHVCLHCASGGHDVKLSTGETHDHQVPRSDDEALKEFFVTAAASAVEIGAANPCAALGDFSLTMVEADH